MESKKFRLFLIFNFSFFIVNCFSQHQNYFTHLTIEDGLSQSSIFSIIQDDIGYMWFATEDGLNKYDGNKFTVYRPIENDTTSLPDLGIRKVFKDNSGRVWIISLRGRLCYYDQDKNNFKRFSFTNNGKLIKIISIVESKEGKIWIASTKGEFYSFNKNKNSFEKFKLSPEIEKQFNSIHLQCLLVAKDNTFWIGTWEGLINFDPATQKINWYKYSRLDPNSLSGDMVFSLDEDANGNIWIASANGGISVLNYITKSFKVYKQNLSKTNCVSSNRIMSVLVDNRNKVWIGTFDKGLDLYDPESKSFINFSHNPAIQGSFSIGAVMSMYQDKSGGIWFGTGGGGLNRFDILNQNFHHLKYTPGSEINISPNPILAICEDHLGNLWIGSDGGGINFRPANSQKFISFLQNPVFGSNAISVIYEDSKGNVWIGADPGAESPAGILLRFDRTKNSFIPVTAVKINLGGISAIKEDRFGEIWIATPSDGVHRYNPKTNTDVIYNFNSSDSKSISSNSIFSICEDSDGNLWFGSIASGLNRFNRKENSFTRFVNDPKNKNSIGNNAIWCIAEDENKNIWIGLWGGGINKYDRKENIFTRFTIDDGLPGNIVYGIIPDLYGNLWISSNKGLSKFNKESQTFRNYNSADGLLINDFSAGASFKGKDGRLFFGGNSGVVFFNPKNVLENNFSPNITITDFKIFDKSIGSGFSITANKEIILDYDQNFFTIEFASFDFTAPEKNRFEYKLDGVDKNWISSEGLNFASYTDITNGNYRFRLRGSNSSGKFNNKEVVLSIIIDPPFWKTWWFRTIVAITIILLLYLVHKYRLNRLLEVERTRVKIARDLHDEVSASITGIVYFADAIKTEIKQKDIPVITKLVNMVSESATQIQEAMSDIIWSINPDNDDWKIVLPKLRRYASDLCESKNINYKIDIPENFIGKSLKMEQRHDLWLIFKEIITNAVKHSSCTEVEIKLFSDSELLYLIISDNGKGFDSSVPSTNNGVKNIKSRTKNLNGVVELITSKNNGTKWNIKIPLTSKR